MPETPGDRLREAATLDTESALATLGSSAEGLDERTARQRLARFGPNVVAHEQAAGLGRLLWQRIRNPLVLLLLSLACVSIFIGDARSAVLMIVMILIGVTLGAVQEARSSRAEAELEALVTTSATVLRKRRREIPQRRLVPGDVVALSAGDLVPADLRLLWAKDFSVNQAPLSGEALPVDKHAQAVAPGQASLPELGNLCFMGSSVVSGSAEGVVVLTGKQTLLGALAEKIVGTRSVTSFERGIDQFTWLMLRFIFVMVPIVFVLNGALKGDWFEALLFSVSVAVGLTPEMLPMIVTVNLAKGALAMSRRQVIVKRLNAIQNLGGMDILCADKTGTITQNKVILERHIDILGHETAEVLKYAYLNSLHQTGLKNLLDVAVLKRGELEHIRAIERQYEKVDEIPFDFTRKRMSVVLRDKTSGHHLLVCKGAVEEVYDVSREGYAQGHAVALDESHRRLLGTLTRQLNEDGFRVIAVAIKRLEPAKHEYAASDERDLALVGYLAFLDPPKETAAEAISALHRAGVRVKILTGDNDVVTRKICRDVGLNVSRIVLGSEIAQMSVSQLDAAVEHSSIFAKLTPDQKARIIEALHRREHVVGFLGDGINDGPALRAADVGLSVDSAVDIAKESADIILLQKSLLVLHDGVLEGRKVFANIVKYIRMAASSNFGNMFSVLGASAFLPFLPMQPIQVLANNLLYDLSQTAIPTDNVDAEELLKPQQWKIGNLKRFILFIGPLSSIFDYTTFAALLFFFHAGNQPALFQTGWFVESLATQTLIIHVIRTRKIPFVQSRASLPLLLTSTAIIALGVVLPYSPLQSALRLAPLPLLYWPFLAATLLAYVALTQLVKGRLARGP